MRRGNEELQPPRHLPGQCNARCAPKASEQEALQQQLTDHPRARGAQRQPDTELLLPSRGTNQHQIRHVGADDQQKNGASPEQGLEQGAMSFAPQWKLENRHQRRADTCVTRWITLRETPRNGLISAWACGNETPALNRAKTCNIGRPRFSSLFPRPLNNGSIESGSQRSYE